MGLVENSEFPNFLIIKWLMTMPVGFILGFVMFEYSSPVFQFFVTFIIDFDELNAIIFGKESVDYPNS